ncbi:MAG: PAS domain-containing protein, partial [Armatimonadota bacterium]
MDADLKRPFGAELDPGHAAWAVSFLPEAAAVLDDQLVVVAANPRFAETTDLPGEIIGRNISEFLSNESLGELETALEALRAGCAPVVWTDLLVRGGGAVVPCRAGLSRFGGSDSRWFILTLRRDELSRLGLVLDRMAEGVLVVDSARRVVYANQPFFRMCGLDRARVIGAPLDGLLRFS